MVFDFSKIGGDEEDRTLDLTDANRTLSQLSYAPIGLLCDYKIFFAVCQVFGGGLEKFFFAAPVLCHRLADIDPAFGLGVFLELGGSQLYHAVAAAAGGVYRIESLE